MVTRQWCRSCASIPRASFARGHQPGWRWLPRLHTTSQPNGPPSAAAGLSVMWIRFTPWLVCLSILASRIAVAAPGIDGLVGSYKVPAVRCSEVADGRMVPCSSQVSDCLEIRKISPTKAWVRFSSAQANLHECSDEGEAEVTPRGLLFCPAAEEYRGQCLVVEANTQSLVLHLRSRKGDSDAFCAPRATVEGLRFARRVRRTQGTCSE